VVEGWTVLSPLLKAAILAIVASVEEKGVAK
jgi:hypothetical protein